MQQKQTFSAAHTGYYNAFYCLLNDRESISNSAVHFSIQWSLQFRTVSHMYSANHRFFNLQQTYCHGHPHQKHKQIYYFFIHLIIYTFLQKKHILTCRPVNQRSLQQLQCPLSSTSSECLTAVATVSRSGTEFDTGLLHIC